MNIYTKIYKFITNKMMTPLSLSKIIREMYTP
jgi:hypothetical protein